MNQHKQTGFTLVELVMVIVLLGTLSAVALPKFFENSVAALDADFNCFSIFCRLPVAASFTTTAMSIVLDATLTFP